MRKVVSTILFLSAVLSVAGAFAYSIYLPRLFTSYTEFQLRYPDADTPNVPSALEAAQKRFPTLMKKPLTARVDLQPMGAPGFYRLSAIHPHPLDAVTTANTLTLLLSDNLRERIAAEEFRVIIIQPGELPRTPSHPDVQSIMRIGMIAAGICVAIGILVRRSSVALRQTAREASSNP